MKTYLVACDLGSNKIESYTVETDDVYVPASDDMLALKRRIIKEHEPYRHSASPASHSCGGCLARTGHGRITDPGRLKVIAVSRLDI